MGQREVAYALPAPLLVELPHQALEPEALGFVEPVVGLLDQDGLGSEVHGGDRVGEAAQPRPQEVVSQVVAAPPRPGLGEDGQAPLDHAVPIREDLDVPADLLLGRWAHVPDVTSQLPTAAPGVPCDELEDDIVAAPQLAQEPVVGLGPERRGAAEEHAGQQLPTAQTQHALLVAVPVELGYALEEVPEEEQALRILVSVLTEDRTHRGDIEVVQLDVVGGPVVERRGPVLQQRHQLGVDGPQDEEAARDVGGVGRELVHHGLEVGRELVQVPAAEVLELVEGHDVARPGEVADHQRQLPQARGAPEPFGLDAEGVHRVGHRRQHPRRSRVRDLHVEDVPSPDGIQCLLDEGGLPDAPSPGDPSEEPAPPPQDGLQLVELRAATVESPGHRVLRGIR